MYDFKIYQGAQTEFESPQVEISSIGGRTNPGQCTTIFDNFFLNRLLQYLNIEKYMLLQELTAFESPPFCLLTLK